MFGVLLTDVLKAFACLSHKLLAVELKADGVDIWAVSFFYDYLTARKQRTKIEDRYNPWRDLIFGVPQGLTLEPLSLNI